MHGHNFSHCLILVAGGWLDGSYTTEVAVLVTLELYGTLNAKKLVS